MEQISNYIPSLKSEYFINTYGVIYSMIRNQPEVIIGKLDKDGYHEVGLYRIDGTRKHMRVHRVMGVVYLNLELDGDLEMNHKNGIKDDNDLNNLEVVTSSENKLHSINVLGNTTIQNLPRTHRAVKIYDKKDGSIFKFESITEMVNNMENFNYDYICNKLSKNNGNYMYKNRYSISYD